MNGRYAPALVMLLLAACGAPSSPGAASASCGLPADKLDEFLTIPSGSFLKGRDAIYQEEAPAETLHVEGFAILSHEVTNTEFARFVEETGYVTDAERSAAAGGEAAGSAVFLSAEGSISQAPWKLVPGATWKSPSDCPRSTGPIPAPTIAIANPSQTPGKASSRFPIPQLMALPAHRRLVASARTGSAPMT